MKSVSIIRRRIRGFTWFFIISLILSGATALPLQYELDALVKVTGAQPLVEQSAAPPVWALWLTKVQIAIHQIQSGQPFMFYGTDWLAFGHFVIALAFIGALHDPLRNVWLFTFGMLACALILPYAMLLGALRGIPLWWRCIDCSFGIIGFIPMSLCRRWCAELAVNQSAIR